MDDDTRVRMADEVKRTMQTQAMIEAFRRAEATCISEWRNGKTTEDREKAHAKLAALEELKRQLQAMQDDGQIIRAKRRAQGVK